MGGVRGGSGRVARHSQHLTVLYSRRFKVQSLSSVYWHDIEIGGRRRRVRGRDRLRTARLIKLSMLATGIGGVYRGAA